MNTLHDSCHALEAHAGINRRFWQAQLAEADALEQAGHRDEADVLRVRVALENETMLLGVGGLAASLPRIVGGVVKRLGREVPGGVNAESPSIRGDGDDISGVQSRIPNVNSMEGRGGTGSNFGRYSTVIDDKVTVLQKNEGVPDWIQESFLDSNYRTFCHK